MTGERTDAWILRRGPGTAGVPGALEHARIDVGRLGERDVLVEPLFGCWEGNMSHAIGRRPIDIAAVRGEDFVVLGNAGVVRVLRAGSEVGHLAEGTVCMLYGDVINDEFGYPIKVLGFDAPGSRGLLTRRLRLPVEALIPIPEESTLSLEQWAAMSVRYVTGWENWRVAYGCWRVQMPELAHERMHVWSWGGGVGLAQLWLARRLGCKTAMVASTDFRLKLIEESGHVAIDRRDWPALRYDPRSKRDDPERYARFRAAEKLFLQRVAQETDGRGVDIFIDHIGLPVYRSTLKALARQGVVATAGWKLGMKLEVHRAAECIGRHTHVHTHGSRTREAWASVRTAEAHGFRPPLGPEPTVPWEEIPALARRFGAGEVESYFPIYQVNPV